jgi:hypothetical protein
LEFVMLDPSFFFFFFFSLVRLLYLASKWNWRSFQRRNRSTWLSFPFFFLSWIKLEFKWNCTDKTWEKYYSETFWIV